VFVTPTGRDHPRSKIADSATRVHLVIAVDEHVAALDLARDDGLAVDQINHTPSDHDTFSAGTPVCRASSASRAGAGSRRAPAHVARLTMLCSTAARRDACRTRHERVALWITSRRAGHPLITRTPSFVAGSATTPVTRVARWICTTDGRSPRSATTPNRLALRTGTPHDCSAGSCPARMSINVSPGTVRKPDRGHRCCAPSSDRRTRLA